MQDSALDVAFADICNALGCEPDNEAALGAIESMKEQLSKAASLPSVCHCTLSGEFHDISGGGCELCEKALAGRADDVL